MNSRWPRVRSWFADGRLGGTLFWLWNVVFVTFMLLGFGPALLPELLHAARQGDVPWTFVGLVAVLVAVPLGALALGYWRFRGDGRLLLALGYAVEGPLMALLALRVFGFREANPAMALLLALMALGLLVYLWQMVDAGIGERGTWAQLSRLTGLCLLVLAGLYAASWAIFYLPPLAVFMVQAVQEFLSDLPTQLRHFWSELSRAPRIQKAFILLLPPTTLLTGLLVAALPVMSVLQWLAAWRRARGDLARRMGPGRTAAVALAAVVAAMAGLALASRQPQQRVFRDLDRAPADWPAAEALLGRSDAIREGLLNAYLARQRYLSARGDVDHIRSFYTDMTLGDRHLASPAAAVRIQAAYDWLTAPMLYQPAQPEVAYGGGTGDLDDEGRQTPVLQADPRRAAELYEAFFDVPIDVAERPTILRTVSANWNLERAGADRMAIDDREVHVSRRELAVVAAADGWAEIELHEAYENQTFQQQEVVYHFSLPESGTVTGLWLGETEDREQRLPFQVAPRGAAQQVYREERARRVDPALVEQVGPRQYRLRVFPVPARVWTGESGQREARAGRPLHLWLTIVVPARRRIEADGIDDPGGFVGDGNGGVADGVPVWPLPRLTERKNVYWDDATAWQLPEGVASPQAEAWLPAALPAEPAGARAPGMTTLDFDGWRAEAWPIDLRSKSDNLEMPERAALVVDRSRSMAAVRRELDAALAAWDSPGVSVDVVLGASAGRGEPASLVSLAGLLPDRLTAYGGQDPVDLFRQAQHLTRGRRYDAVLVLTDDSPYRSTSASTVPMAPWTGGPLWLVHLADRMPQGYDDRILDAVLASGGGVAGSVEEALRRWGMRLGSDSATARFDQVDGWNVTVLAPIGSDPSAGQPASAPAAPIRKALARQVLLARARAAGGRVTEAAELDRLQSLAKAEGIVSPFSSMIVLVDDRQRQRLDELANGADRFAREVEASAAEQAVLAVTAVPEPETWMLLLVAAGLLGWWWRRQAPGSLGWRG
jgi:hypothetical protein